MFKQQSSNWFYQNIKDEEDTNKWSEENWIPLNIKKRICRRYFLSDKEENVCCCGYKLQDHEETTEVEDTNKKWDANTDTIHKNTDAYGEISFSTYTPKNSKFVRIDNKSNMETSLELLTQVWDLQRPNLLISVTGGAKTFAIKPKLKDAFSNGLMKAAYSTGAWIITGGTNAGVMKLVGEAVHDYAAINGSKGQVIAIGVAPWGVIAEKHQLINSKGSWPANYIEPEKLAHNETTLDPNHSHFLLIDNGTQHKFATEIAFRSKLERAISHMKTKSGQQSLKVPIVCVVLEGGPGTLETVKSAIHNGTPCVIVEGSGRAADILAYAYNNSTEDCIEVTDNLGLVHTKNVSIVDGRVWEEVRKKITEHFGETDVDKRVDWVKECFIKRDHITVFRLDAHGCNSSSSKRDLDHALLQSLLKVNRHKSINQLRLALAWNRIDIAKEEIFAGHCKVHWKEDELFDIFYSAVESDMGDFVEILMENGVNLHGFLNVKRLLKLYNSIPPKSLLSTLLKQIKQSKYYSLKNIGHLLENLLGNFYKPLYLRNKTYKYFNPKYFLGDDDDNDTSISNPMFTNNRENLSENDMKSPYYSECNDTKNELYFFSHPARELFIYSILTNRLQMSMLFLSKTANPIAACLTAQKLFSAMLQETDDSELIKEIISNINHYETFSISLLNECYMNNEQKTRLMLVRQIEAFGQATILTLAVAADNKQFIAHSACQKLLNNIWMGRISLDTRFSFIVLGILCPIIIFTPLIRYRSQDILWRAVYEANSACDDLTKSIVLKVDGDSGGNSNTVELKRQESKRNMEKRIRKAVISQQNENRKKFIFLQKIIAFYNSPLVTFLNNCIAYCFFLLFYSYILLTDFHPTTSKYEWILIIWIVTLFMEEVRQVIANEGLPLHLKLLSYITSVWNILDFVALLSFVIGFILKWNGCSHCLEVARIVLAINLMIFYFRILNIFSIHKDLGPKLVMIGKMMVDLCSFFFIILIFVLAYGLAIQAILFPNSKMNWDLVQKVFHKAYFQIYGELFLEEMAGENECGGTTGVECPSEMGKIIAPILLALYILFANVLMLNLLIAMFSYTFEKIQENTDIFWYFQRYALIKEYYEKPPIVPPFVVFAHVFLIIRYFWRIFKKNKQVSTVFNIVFSCNLVLEEEEKEIEIWEKLNMDDYMRKKEETEKNMVDNRIKEIDERVEQIANQIDDITESSILSKRTTADTKLPVVLEERLSYLESQMRRGAKAMDYIIENIRKTGGCKIELPDIDKEREEMRKKLDLEIKQNKIDMTDYFLKQLNLHMKSRNRIYSKDPYVERFEVADSHVFWENKLTEYYPVSFTQKEILENPNADPDLLKLSVEERLKSRIKFNADDPYYKVNRKSYLGNYKIEDGLPLNPVGRTGLIGRGFLWRWGPNHAGDPILTRWKRDENNEIVKDIESGKMILEFVAIEREDTNEIAIPGAILDAVQGKNRSIHSLLMENFFEEALGTVKESGQLLEKSISQLFANPLLIYKGYSDDDRNTDNAWIETICYNYHDESGEIMKNMKFKAGGDARIVMWKEVSCRTAMFASHLPLLQKVSRERKSYF